jgi:hypothetical protein
MSTMPAAPGEAPRPDRLDALLLARLAASRPPLSAEALARELRPCAPPSLGDARWQDLVNQALGRLRAAGSIEGELTARRAPAATSGLFAGTAWKDVIERDVPALALGLSPKDARSLKKLKGRDHWAAAIVGRERGIWQGGPPPSPAAVCDALVWQGLGLPGKAKRVPTEIRAYFLGRLIETPGPPDRLLRLLAARELGAPRADLRSLRLGLVRRWLCAPERDGEAAFVRAVGDAARQATDGTFGRRKVFIASLWRTLRDHPALRGADLEAFKQRLLEAHRAGRLTLARADLTSAMDPELLAASEVAHLEARYHFIEREEAP